jgi:hypothetical protein
VPGDYDGNGVTDIAVWRPQNGYWYVKNIKNEQWGAAGDVPVSADYNGDAISDLAVWRPSIGYWFIKNYFNILWGMAGDIPVR